MQTTATPTADGKGYVLNGEKRWITNGGIAQVLTVMARTPVAGRSDTKITAFVVTPDMPGFEVVEKRMPSAVCGARQHRDWHFARCSCRTKTCWDIGQRTQGRADSARLRPHDVRRQLHRRGQVLLGPCRAARSARVQFQQSLANFELVKEKIAYMTAGVFAMESATYQTAALIDSGNEDYMLETAMLKVFSTDVLWRIVNDTIQIFGGKAYFSDEPYERMMRDARINMIGEGANDVLRAFIALVGMRDVGLELKGVLEAAKSPWKNLGKLSSFAGRRIESMFAAPTVEVHEHASSTPMRLNSAKLVAHFGAQVERVLRTYQEEILDREYQQGRIADAAIELYVSACVLKRLDHLLADHERPAGEVAQDLATGRYYSASRPNAGSAAISTTCGPTTMPKPRRWPIWPCADFKNRSTDAKLDTRAEHRASLNERSRSAARTFNRRAAGGAVLFRRGMPLALQPPGDCAPGWAWSACGPSVGPPRRRSELL